jgi:hypothetical protein
VARKTACRVHGKTQKILEKKIKIEACSMILNWKALESLNILLRGSAIFNNKFTR